MVASWWFFTSIYLLAGVCIALAKDEPTGSLPELQPRA